MQFILNKLKQAVQRPFTLRCKIKKKKHSFSTGIRRIWPKVGIRQCLTTSAVCFCGGREETSVHLILIHISPYLLLPALSIPYVLKRWALLSITSFAGCWRSLRVFRGSSLNQLEHFSFHPFKLFLKTHTEEKNGTVFRASILPEQLRHWILSFCVIPPPPAALRGARSGSQYAHIPQPPFQAQRSSMRRLCPLAGIAALVSCRNLPQLFLFRPCAIFRKQLLSFRPSLR